MKHFKTLPIALAVIGLMGATILVGWYGFDNIASAIFSVGAGGFAVLGAWQVVVFAILGLSWRSILPAGSDSPLAAFVWGRMVRDSAASCLPFSQVGGFVLGARAASLHGVSGPVASVSMVVDLTAEFLAELVFAAGGLLVLLGHDPDVSLTLPIAIGFVGILVLGLVVFQLQARVAPLFLRIGRRVLGDWLEAGMVRDGASQTDLAAMCSRTNRVLLSTGIHVVGWFGKGLGNWIAFRLLGSDIDLASALAIEGLLHALLIPAFLIPGYAGVQEAGYAGIGLLFGIPPELSIAVSLLRRGRDVALGIPILFVWQFVEMRRLRFRSRNRQTEAPHCSTE
jgi:glycosyltransferase 2 family protein